MLVEGRLVVQVVFRDVAARKVAEAELQRALERLARHMDNTPLGVVELAPGPAGQRGACGLVRPGGGDLRLAAGGSRADLEELGLFHEGDADKGP